MSADRTPLIAAHRGGAGLWPENSMTAFRNSARLPVDQVEFDVHRTRDGRLVVHHDPTIDRMTDGSGPIAERAFDDLARFTLRGTDNDRIPLLSDVLAMFGPTRLAVRLEVKGDVNGNRYRGIEAAIAAALGAAGLSHRAIVTSFLDGVLFALARIEPGLPSIWLVRRSATADDDACETVIARAAGNGLQEIAVHADSLTEPTILQAARAGIRVGAYAAHDRPAIRRMFDLGASVFTTDRPDLALALRSARR